MRKGILQLQSDIVQTLQRPHAGGTHRHDASQIIQNGFDRLLRHSDDFGVHLVLVGIFGLDGLERTGADMQRHLLHPDASFAQTVQHFIREMQTGCRRSDGAFNLGVNGLVCRLVTLFRRAVEIWRNGQLAEAVEYLRKTQFAVIPAETDGVRIARGLQAFGRQGEGNALAFAREGQGTFLPFLEVAHHTFPRTAFAATERALVVVRVEGFEAEHLDTCAREFAEHQTRLYHARIIIYKECIRRDDFSDVVESVFLYLAVAVDQQFGVIPLRQGVLGNPLVRQRIIIVFYQ